MKVEDKTKAQLVDELVQMRQRIYELETSANQRKRAEEALQRKEEYYRSLIENSLDSIAILDGDGTICYESPSAERVLGYTAEELVGESMFAALHPGDIPKLADAFTELSRNPGGTLRTEVRVRRKDGSLRFVEAIGTNLLHDPQVKGVVVNYRDITEHKEADEALRESEVRYRLLAENVSDIIYVMNANRRFTYISPSATRLLGYSVEELMSLTMEEYLTPASLEVALQALAEDQALESLGQQDGYRSRLLEMELRCKDGSTVWTETRLTFLRDPDGQITGHLGVSRDITEHREAEEALRESEVRYRTLVGLSPEGILIHQKGEIVYMNAAGAELHGLASPDEIIGRRVADFTHPDEKDLLEARLRQAEEKQERVGFDEWRLVRLDGQIRVIESAAASITYMGKPARQVITHDITERKQAEEALRQSEEKMRSLIENSPDIIAMVDSGGVIQFINRTVPGLMPEEVVGRACYDFTPPEYHDILRTTLARAFQTGEADSLEAPGVGSDGSTAWYQTRFGPIKSDGQVVAAMLIVTDITERKRAEETRVEHVAALARAEELELSRQRIVTVQESLRRDIAQELHGSVQNGLIILLHRLTELERSASPGELATELGDLRQKLGELLDSHIRPISHRLYPSILRQGLVPALQSLGDQFEAILAIEMELDEELMRQERANRRLIPEQVRLAACRIAEEALTNVVKHAEASRVTLGLELSSEGWLRLTVRDDGQGFEGQSTSGGLGILMMHDYAEVVGGRCAVRSAPGEGTGVTATFPLAESGTEHPERASSLE
ncbi:MAG: PAS domain S-box protein [Dehalococcoidia bacterium]|nr:PAS domain S-box protein [Dehalococcoidia bacterium]